MTWSKRAAAEVEAMVELMFLVARADGDFSPPERRAFLDSVTSLSAGELDSTALLASIERIETTLLRDGLDARLAAAASQLPDEVSRRIALGLCTQMALSDGAEDVTEHAMLDRIAEALGITRDEEEEIAWSVRLSSRPPNG
ncbi:MAG TPA: tellurite resistance TerB family protein [Polyangiaceae bacterium]|nr:tellurite resistance TerB family protein [Polyangiaceae bacterium]